MTDKTEAMDLAKTLDELSKAALKAQAVYHDDLEPGITLANYLRADAALATALVTAYRTGKLVVVPDDAVERPTFPILGSRGARIDLRLVEDHGKQAYANHSQTVTRLAERGGLSWCELHAVLHNRPWQKMDDNTAIEECRAVEARYLAALKGADHAG